MIPNYKGRTLILFPEGWQHGWMSAGFTIPEMTVAEWRDWRHHYFEGIMASPFGHQRDHLMTPIAPWGMSRHGVPKLHPEDI